MKRTESFWTALEALPTGQAVLAEWELEFGAEFAGGRGFLLPTQEQAENYPCTNRFRCECRHRVVVHTATDLVACCECEAGDCRPIRLEPKDVLVWTLDISKFLGAVQRALRFDASASTQFYAAPRTCQVGTYGGLRWPVYFLSPMSGELFLEELEGLFGIGDGHFILLTPTRGHYSGEVESAVKRNRCALIPLSRCLALEGKRFVVTHSIEPILQEFERRLVEGNGAGMKVMERVADGLEALKTAGGLFAGYLPERVRIRACDSRHPENVFCKAGSHWDVVFNGETFHLKHTHGAEYINYLLHHPNTPISAYDLETTIRPEKRARAKETVQDALDLDAMRDYLRELDRLRAKREDASEDGDVATVDRLDGDIEALEKELRRNGRVVDSGERARCNVSKAVTAVRQKLLKGEKNEKAFGEHLQQFLDLGYECIYNQPEGRIWSDKE
jgi:hypothetical protein